MTAAARPDAAFWRGKRVLLTGHTGFKGAWLALWLQRLGAQVTGLALAPARDPWGSKIALDLGHVQTPADTLASPPLRIVHPKVESGRARAVVTRLDRRPALAKLLFDNASEKQGGTVLLYDRLPCPSLDAPDLMTRRLGAMHALLDRASLRGAHATLCGARNCLEGLLDG